ncbi:unnamed protein product, partial [Effrenium voratum]
PLTVPPDGLCAVYCFLAAADVVSWRETPRNRMGFLVDFAREKAVKSDAEILRRGAVALLRADGMEAQAQRLERGGLPVPFVYGDEPVGFEMRHCFSRDGAGAVAGHFELLRSWLPQPGRFGAAEPVLMAAAAAQALPAKRRLRGKQAAPAAYGRPGLSARKLLRSALPRKRRGSTDTCRGAFGAPCRFSTEAPGGPAAARNKGADRCCFCASSAMTQALATARGGGIVARLKVFKSFGEAEPSILAEALRRVELWAPDRAEALRAKAQEPKWRRAVTAEPTPERRKTYRAAVLADQRFAKRRFFPDAPRRARATGAELVAAVDNDCDLPVASCSKETVSLQRWCQQGAWGMCPRCSSLQPRNLTEKALFGNAAAEVAPSACRRCKAACPHFVPKPEDVPEPLRAVRADAGYRKKVRMITLSWAAQSVDDKIRALSREAGRREAKAALDCEYCHFYQRHRDFLARRDGRPTAQQARRPLHFVEEAGLETALWPHLYWATSMCESFERLNARRLAQLEGGRPAAAEDSDGKGSEAGEEDTGAQRQSIKRSFQAKLLSPLLTYGADFELLQYVYDLHLWTDLGSKKGQAGSNAMMHGHPMSPMYWTDVKHGLFDLTAQLGYPQLYWTLAPYERRYPYHVFLLDEMRKLLRSRMFLPAFESMLQICRGL